MKIASITIHNFRSIVHATVQLGDYSLLVGENNAGKSNLIDALRIFYEKELKYEASRDAPKCATSDEEAWIDIEFALTDAEYANLKDEYKLPNQQLKVRKYLQTDQKAADGKKKLGIYGYKTDGAIADEHFYGAKNVQQGKFGEIIYIEDVTRLSEHTKMSGPSALRDLVNDIVKKLVRSSTAFKTLSGHFSDFAQTFKGETTADGASLDGLENDINTELDGWDAAFRLEINSPSEDQIVKNLLSHRIEDRALGQGLDADQFGQGFQRHLIFTLIRLAARYQPAPAPRDKKEFSPQMTLLLFEEPEAFLHPPQQRVLCQSLRAIGQREGNQVLASSHSPYFVSQQIAEIPSIARLRRANGKTEVGQIDDATLQGIFAENQQINDILKNTTYACCADDLKSDMEAVKYCLWLDPERCGVFFARHVLLVEGPTERVLLNFMIDKGKVKVPRGGVFVLDCIGKFNLHRFMNILGPLGVSHSVLFDADGGKPPHNEIKELIEGSKNEHTCAVDTFPEDIETFLGLQRADKPHRRPQHVMLKLQENQIGQDKLDALVQKVHGLIGMGVPA